MIVFSAIVPHSPLLVPTIGGDAREKLADTLQAYTELEHTLYASKPETLLIISPHAQMYPDAFSGNIHDAFQGVLKEFGDHATTLQASVDFLLLDRVHRAMREEQIPFTLTSQAELDYGCTIPLLLLTKNLVNWKLVPIAPSLLGPQAHYEFGRQLARVLQRENRRVAILASADLSHHANAESPHGATTEGETFDRTLRNAVATRHHAELLGLDTEIREKADQCGYQPILTFMGVLEDMNGSMRELCYEAPFGVGYLTSVFEPA